MTHGQKIKTKQKQYRSKFNKDFKNDPHQKNIFSSLAHVLIGSFIFLELSCRSCLYIFEINPLSVASFAIIFSQSESCLFTLLIVSFVVQKLLSFIRSHLFIFAFISNILGGGCIGKTQKDWVEREVGGKIRMENTCKSMDDSCQCMTKTTTIL